MALPAGASPGPAAAVWDARNTHVGIFPRIDGDCTKADRSGMLALARGSDVRRVRSAPKFGVEAERRGDMNRVGHRHGIIAFVVKRESVMTRQGVVRAIAAVLVGVLFLAGSARAGTVVNTR